MWPNENIVKLEAIREEHNNARILTNIENLIGLYEVLDLLWATVDGNFNVTLDESNYNDAREVNRFTFQLLRDLEVKTRESLSGGHSNLDLRRKLQVLSAISKITGSDSRDIDAMLAVFSNDDEWHDIERLLEASQSPVNDARDAATGIINDALNAGREFLEWETEAERDARLTREAEAREAARYQWNPELLERAHTVFNLLLNWYAENGDLSSLIETQKMELETLRSDFLAEVEKAIEESRTAAWVLQTEVLEGWPDGNPTITPVPGYETFEEKLNTTASEVTKIYELDAEWNPVMWIEELLMYIQWIEIDDVFEKTNEETFQDLVDTYDIEDPIQKEQFAEMLREAYFESQRFANRLQQEAENEDLTVQIWWQEQTFDNLLEKRRTIAVGLQVAKALAETPEGIQSLVTDKDGVPSALLEKIRDIYNAIPNFWTDINWIFWVLGTIFGLPIWTWLILKWARAMNRPNNVEVAARRDKLTEIQKFLMNIWEDRTANRVQSVINRKLNFPEKYFLIEFHRIVYRQSWFMNLTIFWTLRRFWVGWVSVGESDTLFNGDRRPRSNTSTADFDWIARIAKSFNEAFDDIRWSNLDIGTQEKLLKKLQDDIGAGRNIDPNIVKSQILNLELTQNHSQVSPNSKQLISDMILDGRLSTDDVTMDGLFSQDMTNPGVANEIRLSMRNSNLRGRDDVYDIVMRKFLEGEALEDRLITPDEVDTLKRQADVDVRYISDLEGRWMDIEKIQGMFDLQKIDINDDLFGPNWLENSKTYGILMALHSQLELEWRTGDITRLSEIIRDPRIIASIDGLDTTNLATFKESLGNIFGVELENMMSIEQIDEQRGRTMTVWDRTYDLRGLSARERLRLAVTFRGASLERRVAELVANGKATEILSEESVEMLRIKMNNAFELITRAELQAEVQWVTGVDFNHFRTLAIDNIEVLDLTSMETDIQARTGFTDILDFRALITEKLRIEWVATDEADSILRVFDSGADVSRLDPTLATRSYFDYIQRVFRKGRI